MNYFDALFQIAAWVGWPIVALCLLVILAIGKFVYGQRIERLKDTIDGQNKEIEYVGKRLVEAQNFSPDVLLERMTKRHAMLEKEVRDSDASNEKLLLEKQSELEKSLQEIETLRNGLNDILETTKGLLCPHCKAPLSTKECDSFTVEDHEGREIDIDHEVITYECGLTIHNGKEVTGCGSYYKQQERAVAYLNNVSSG